MSIRLHKPYKIIPPKHKKYESHYLIPAADALVVPMKAFGEEVSCDVRWEDNNGELKAIHNIAFINDNLMPLNPMIDEKLFELWQHYYQQPQEK